MLWSPAMGVLQTYKLENHSKFQSQVLGVFVGSPWYVSHQSFHTKLNLPFVEDESRVLQLNTVVK